MKRTEVIFQIFKDTGNCCAFFPYDIVSCKGDINSYMHIGQHSAANFDCCVAETRKAKPEEYLALLEELYYVGYRKLKIIKRRSHSKYLEAWNIHLQLLEKRDGK